jgi:hypothetical protein
MKTFGAILLCLLLLIKSMPPSLLQWQHECCEEETETGINCKEKAETEKENSIFYHNALASAPDHSKTLSKKYGITGNRQKPDNRFFEVATPPPQST